MNSPKAVVLSGPPCAGKSTLARALSRRTGLVHLEMDRIRTAVLPSSSHAKADRNIGYRTMHLVGEHLLKQGAGVIFDATYSRVEPRRWLAALARRIEVSVYLVECRLPGELAAARFGVRRGAHPAMDLDRERVRRLAAAFAFFGRGLTVTTTGGAPFALKQVVNYLERVPEKSIVRAWASAPPKRSPAP